MSVDTVDDLHYAEDVIGCARATLERAARDLHLFHGRGSIEECRKEACVRLRADLAPLVGYCRPSCERDEDGRWMCGEDCGCPGQHPTPHGDEVVDDDTD